jgi:anthranilate synthase/aminodeoxychorismate synthase-like glutamine amidotransferase
MSEFSQLLAQSDCLIIGPGPTDPIRAGLIDIVKQSAALQVPTLGICLGYQAIGLAFGAQLIRTHPLHGKRSQVTFTSSRLFPHTGGERTVMRYHSLSLSDIRSPLRTVASSRDGIPMAIEHESLPIAGLQFHPDSYATNRGREMLADFFEAIR